MSTTTPQPARSGVRAPRLHTIGAVCARLQPEFPDISISKIRYLEDQGLLTPQRTRGGYRLFGEDDVERLETILRLQRDEFLPLRVIRQELATRRRRRQPHAQRPDRARGAGGRARLRASSATAPGIDAALRARARGVRAARAARSRAASGSTARATPTSRRPAARLAQYGIDARHLRTFRNSADREAGLLEQLVAPALRSRNPERRKAGLDDLQALAETSQELSRLLFWRGARGMPAPSGRVRAVSTPGAALDLHDRVRDVPDFPKPGIVFKDLMPLVADPAYFRETIERLAELARPLRARRHPRRRGARLHLRRRARRPARLRLRAGAEAGQAAVGDGRGDVRARVRHRQPRRCTRTRSARAPA